MSASPEVSIVIRCRNAAQVLRPVLDRVFAQQGAPAFEVVALDSGSRDGTLQLLEAYKVRIEHIAIGKFTYGHALNRGTTVARAPVVVYLSAYCLPADTAWLARLIGPFSEPDVVATFGRQVPLPDVNPIEALTVTRNFPATGPARLPFSTANGAARRDAVLARPFDDQIPVAEGYLWARGVHAPLRIAYVPGAVVSHARPMGYATWSELFYDHGFAAAYARRRLGMELPWGDPNGGVLAGGSRALASHVRALLTGGGLRFAAQLPRYLLARAWAYRRGMRDATRRYGTSR